MLQQSHAPLTNGIMSFLQASEDYALAPIGIGSMHEQARKLAEFGRHGDIYFIHAAEGETVIPLEVLNANPKVKGMLFNQMREMGLDPEEFVVGNKLNSINPVTGMPEFFFSSVFRSVKRVLKKIAPVVLPLVAAAFGVPFLGPAFGAGTFGASFLASGIGTLIEGGSLGDAFKSGLVSGGLSSLTSGLGGAFSESGTFLGGLEGSFTGATPVFEGGTQIGTRMAASPWAQSGLNLTGASPAALKAGQAASAAQWDTILGRGVDRDILGGVTQGTIFDPATGRSPGFVPEAPSITGGPASQNWITGPGEYTPLSSSQVSTASGSVPQPVVRQAPPLSPRIAAARDPAASLTLQAQNAAEAAIKAKDAPWYNQLQGTSVTFKDVMDQLGPGAAANMPTSIVEKAMVKVNPGLLRKYGPLAAGLGLAAYAGGAFDPVETEQPTKEDLEFTGPTSAQLLEEDPEKYLIPEEALNPWRYDMGNPLVPTIYSAHGGLAEYPPRDLLVEGAGTESSDEIPAMLSDGEFVMNAKSVRGADPSGRGDRYAGANNLYNMMRNFEMRS